MKKTKTGFTLIEIIICIALIAIIGVGSVVGINYAKKVSMDRKIAKAYSPFDDALEVYLSDHPEIYNNLSENVEGAVITLELLKNEGLVNEGIKDPSTNQLIDYKDSYYVLSDAVLLSEDKGEENTCDGQVSLNVLKSWDTLKDKVETSDIIYICPKDGKKKKDDIEEIKDLKERLETLEYSLALSNLGGNNYVYFDVNNSMDSDVKWNTGDLWQIVSTNDGIKLMYNQPIISEVSSEVINMYKNELLEDYESKTCDYKVTGSGNLILLNNSKVFEVGNKSASSTYKCVQEDKKSCEMSNVDGSVYCRYSDDLTWNEKRWRNVINPNEICPSTSEYKSGYDNDFEGNISSFVKDCSISKNMFNKLNDKINVKYIDVDVLNNDEKSYKLNGLFSINYYSIFEYSVNDEKSVKKVLFDNINDKLKGSIVEEKYYDSYTYLSDSSQINMNNISYTDKLGTITLKEAETLFEKNSSALVGKKISLGAVDDKVLTYESNGWKLYASKFTNVDEYKVNIDSISYYPAIKLNDKYVLEINLANYPESYKTACGSFKLGSAECPYLIKIGEYYSNGDHV